jgi:hypothetical protein
MHNSKKAIYLQHKLRQIFAQTVSRANPFSKVTDLICRLPSSALLYRPEVSNLGHLLRFMVRMHDVYDPLDFQRPLKRTEPENRLFPAV